MNLEDMREPSLNDLCGLSVLANLAYAVRCARRMRPRFRLDDPYIDKMTELLDGAIHWTEEYVGQGTGQVAKAEHLRDMVSAIAEETYEDTDYAAYAAFHAINGAIMVARAGENCDADTAMEVVAAAYGASRVLLTNTPPWVRTVAIQALRNDYAKLLELSVAEATQMGPQMDTSEAGPLGGWWPGKTPQW